MEIIDEILASRAKSEMKYYFTCTHAHTKLVLWQDIILIFFPSLSEMPFPRQFSEAHFCISHLSICSLLGVPLMFLMLAIIWLYSWHLVIFLLFLSSCLQKLIWYFQRKAHNILGWVLLWPRWLLIPFNFCLDEFEICFVILSLKTACNQAFAQYFHSN